MMAEVRMSMEEYLQLLNGLSGDVAREVDVAGDQEQPKKRKGKKNPKLARAVKEANAKLRTASGKLRKGKTQADVMRLAHRLLKKM